MVGVRADTYYPKDPIAHCCLRKIELEFETNETIRRVANW